MKNIAPIMWFLLMIVVGLAQLRLGYLGIEHHLGTVAAVILSIAAFLGILLPITIGSYFGAVDVMGWPIWVGLLVAVPGLFFATPMIMLNIIQSVVPIRTNRASDLAAVSLSESPSDEHRTMVDQTNRIQSSGERVDSPYRSEDKINEEFEKLAQYSSRLADIDDQLSEVPTRHRVEFRRSVLMSPSPLLHAAALGRILIK